MKLRHVRAVAVVAGVMIALTGAKRSHGGSCDNSSSSSSSSSSSTGGTSGDTSGGSTHYDDDDDDYGSGTGAGAEASEAPAGEAAAEDVKIDSCKPDGNKMAATVRATNSSATTQYTYTFTVTFKDKDGKQFHTGNYLIQAVPAGSSDTLTMLAEVPAAADGFTYNSGAKCELSNARRLNES
ncbi:hypothetical protein [Streptomyces caeruleatus]|uniref:Uncharacterized protein n=1 Tax=Streptomyces caeruleatus TaxID=661399 RepID=A0A101TSC9_9ACTN|nr:hypothetical protein [Streptomyces caeruleatus]KUN97594.1 hypothetical protein AQJ67_29710 [Streptomyces caeruleatus]